MKISGNKTDQRRVAQKINQRMISGVSGAAAGVSGSLIMSRK